MAAVPTCRAISPPLSSALCKMALSRGIRSSTECAIGLRPEETVRFSCNCRALKRDQVALARRSHSVGSLRSHFDSGSKSTPHNVRKLHSLPRRVQLHPPRYLRALGTGQTFSLSRAPHRLVQRTEADHAWVCGCDAASASKPGSRLIQNLRPLSVGLCRGTRCLVPTVIPVVLLTRPRTVNSCVARFTETALSDRDSSCAIIAKGIVFDIVDKIQPYIQRIARYCGDYMRGPRTR